MTGTADITEMQSEIAALRARLGEAEQTLADMENALTVAVEHGDIIERQLVHANEQLQQEISERETAQRRLQALVDAISQQKDDLEIIVSTLVEHGDSLDQHMWTELLASETRGATDPLTGLANRRSFDDHLFAQFSTCARNNRPLTLLMCDVDFFKQYNDTYGHAAGDDCLKRVASVIDDHALRPTDLAARYGGEEFVIVLPETDAEGGRRVADMIVAGVKAMGMAHENSAVADVVTISVGGRAVVPKPADDPQALIVDADHLLYRAKQLGRGRAVFGDDTALRGEA